MRDFSTHLAGQKPVPREIKLELDHSLVAGQVFVKILVIAK